MVQRESRGAIFDLTKLNWINGQHLARFEVGEFLNHLKPYCIANNIDLESRANFMDIVSAMRSSSDTLDAIAKDLYPYFNEVASYDEKALDKFVKDTSLLNNLKNKLEDLSSWNEEVLDAMLAEVQSTLGLSTPQINQPIRIALTGSTKSPSLGLTLSLFTKEETLERIDALVNYLDQ
jgi:glutamyl-tRNA synthetase